MPALERLAGVHVVALPEALDGARWVGGDVRVLRFAPDEAFAIDAETAEVDDPDALVEDERGFAGTWCPWSDLEPHIEWPLDGRPPFIHQGKVAGIPAKVLFDGDRVLLVTQAAYAADLETRLGWHR